VYLTIFIIVTMIIIPTPDNFKKMLIIGTKSIGKHFRFDIYILVQLLKTFGKSRNYWQYLCESLNNIFLHKQFLERVLVRPSILGPRLFLLYRWQWKPWKTLERWIRWPGWWRRTRTLFRPDFFRPVWSGFRWGWIRRWIPSPVGHGEDWKPGKDKWNITLKKMSICQALK